MRKTTDKEKYFYMLSGFIMPCILTMLTLLKPRIFCTFYYLFLPLSVISVILYFIGAGIFIEGFTEKLGKYILKGKTDKDGNQKKREPNKLTCSLGHIDRFIYAFCFILKLYPALGMWFGLKVASRLVSPRESEKNKKITFKEEGERKNVYLIGNVTSLVLGLLGGVLIGILLLGVPLDSIF